MPAYELCLRFVLSNPAVSPVPTGRKTVEHLEASVAAAETSPLSEDMLQRLDEIAEMMRFGSRKEQMILPFGDN